MDNIKRLLPIRKYQLQHPLFVVFNIHLTHFNAYRTSHYDRVLRTLTSENGANIDKNYVHLVPNIINLDSSIESRGKYDD